MLKVIAEDFIRPEHVDTVMPLYRELVRLTRKEPLCLAYDLFTDQRQPGHFVFIEEWPDQAALDAPAPASISAVWSRRSTPFRKSLGPTS